MGTSCWESTAVQLLGQYECVWVCMSECVFVYSKYKAARSNLGPAVYNGRQRENLDVFISEAISLLVKVKRLLTFISLKVCVCFICVWWSVTCAQSCQSWAGRFPEDVRSANETDSNWLRVRLTFSVLFLFDQLAPDRTRNECVPYSQLIITITCDFNYFFLQIRAPTISKSQSGTNSNHNVKQPPI